MVTHPDVVLLERVRLALVPLIRRYGLKAVSQASGVNYADISKIISGRQRFPLAATAKIARAVGYELRLSLVPIQGLPVAERRATALAAGAVSRPPGPRRTPWGGHKGGIPPVPAVPGVLPEIAESLAGGPEAPTFWPAWARPRARLTRHEIPISLDPTHLRKRENTTDFRTGSANDGAPSPEAASPNDSAA